MSLASYIGTNVAIPINPHIYDEDFDEILWIGLCFAEPEDVETARTQHFSTTYAYEISSHWGIGTETHRPLDLESKIKLKKLFEILEDYMKPGDYFQLYSCWVGEEDDKSEGSMTVHMDTLNLNELVLLEKTVVTFQF